jgi:hypothetical protein
MSEGSITQAAPRPWLIRAVVLSSIVGLIHMIMTPVYFSLWLGYGAFFFLAGVAFFTYSALLAVNRPRQILFWVGIVASAATLTLWTITRTVGIPFFGPEAGQVEPVGVPDLISKIAEVALIVHLAVLLRLFPQLEQRPLIR